MKKAIYMLIALAIMSGSLFASESFLIQSEIIKNGKIIGSPMLLVPFKQAGAVEQKTSQNSYELLAEIDQKKSNAVIVYTNLTLNGKFHKQKSLIVLNKIQTISMGDVSIKMKITPHL